MLRFGSGVQRAVFLQQALHEDQVPELEEALRVVAGTVLLAAVARPAVEVQLRARAARAGRPRLPEVVRARQAHDPLLRDADGAPALDRLLIGSDAERLVAGEDGDPDPLGIEPEALRRQLPGVVDRLLLEVVADREVAQHLEERQVASGQPHLVDVRGAKALLAGGQARMRRLLLAQEVGPQRLHAGGRQQHRRVIRGRDEGSRRHAPVIARLEEREEGLADLRGCRCGHWRSV